MRSILAVFFSLLCTVCSTGQAARPLIVLAASEYPPYYGRNLPMQGAVVEIVVEAYRASGYDVELRFYPFARAMQAAKDGQFDGLIALWHRREREQWFAFSPPLAETRLSFYKRKDAAINSSTHEQLRQYRIGAVRGYAGPSGFDAYQFNTVELVTFDLQNLRKLSAGRIDLVLIDSAQAAYLIKTQAPELAHLLERVGPPFRIDPLHLALSKKRQGYQRRLDAFNRGLAQLAATGQLDKIRERHGL